MPRKPPFKNPIRSVRKTLGKTQAEFASTIGLSRKYLQKIELGEKPVTNDLADFFMAAFGVSQKSVKQRRGEPVHTLSGSTIENLAANIHTWQLLTDKIEEWICQDLETYFLPKLEVLFEAARRKQVTAAFKYPKAMAVGLRFDRWIEEIVDQFQLRKSIDAILTERAESGNPIDWERSLAVQGATEEMVLLPATGKILVKMRRASKIPENLPSPAAKRRKAR
jgi:transcriptional regulator with XRE-family HTH domain